MLRSAAPNEPKTGAMPSWPWDGRLVTTSTRTMPDVAALDRIAAGIETASRLIETKFLQIGECLESSIEILGRLTARLERLRAELEGDDLRRAAQALSRAAEEISQMAGARSEDRAHLDRLKVLTDGIAGRLVHMKQAVRDADALAINAKIASARISESGLDFEDFAREISRTLQLTSQNLEKFGAELRGARDRVGAAMSRQMAFERQQDATVRSIGARLGSTLDCIAGHNRLATQTTTEVARRGDLIRQRIGNAIVALQTGDATHQRLEHAGLGLHLLLEELRPAASEASEADRREHLARSICPAISALLADAATELDRDMQSLGEALNSLAADARSLHELGTDTFGSGRRDGAAFVAELEDPVRQASGLLQSFGEAREGTSEVIAAVSEATGSLSRHLASVRSLEADIRIMGLNATLKCARAGTTGRALGVVAQELRSYANVFETEADALMTEVGEIGIASRSLSTKEDGTRSIAEIAEIMASSLSVFRNLEATLERTLSELGEDSVRVVRLLDETVASVRGRDEIRAALARAIGGFAEAALASDAPGAGPWPEATAIADALERSYTMSSERLVHARFFGAMRPQSALRAATETPALEEALF